MVVVDNFLVLAKSNVGQLFLNTIGDLHTVGPCKKAVFACLATDGRIITFYLLQHWIISLKWRTTH